MWCSSCRQEVPGVSSRLDGKHACARCGTLLAVDMGLDLASFDLEEAAAAESRSARVPTAEETPDFQPVKPPQAEPARISSLRWEAANWELNEKLRHVERVTATSRRFDEPIAGRGAPHFAPSYYPAPRLEEEPPSFAPPAQQPYQVPHYAPTYPSPHSPTGPHGPHPAGPGAPPETAPHEWNEYDDRPRPGEFVASLVSWIFLGLATTAFTCGGFLAAWGAVAERVALQRMGMPIVLGGLLALVIGVLPQVMLRSLEEERRRRERAAEQAAHHGPSHGPQPAAHPYDRRVA